MTIAEQAADCAALLRHLGIESAHVVGHSFGGAVALQLALDAPSKVRSLALLEPAMIIGASAQAYRDSLEDAIERFRSAPTADVVAGMMRARWPEYASGLATVLPGAFERAVEDAAASFEAELPALLDWSFDEDTARQITQPVLSVIGERSPGLSPRFSEVHAWLLQHIPNSEGYALPRAHHFLQVENPDDMAARLATFLAGP
jgi:pimeloyl-ACP methyl ester carboxylesterase